MNNEPVAYWDGKHYASKDKSSLADIPLYTHPVKEQKCVVKDCENHKHEGSFNGDVCSPCYQFIAHGKGIHSQAYRNAKPAELTDEEIISTMVQFDVYSSDDHCLIEAGRAILRKA